MIPKSISGVMFFSAFVFISSAHAGKVELTTYYPAPNGEYSRLQASGSCVGSTCGTAADDVTNDNLKVKGTTTTTNATITGTTTTTNASITTATIQDATITGTTTTGNANVTGTTQTGRIRLTATGTPSGTIPDGTMWIQ